MNTAFSSSLMVRTRLVAVALVVAAAAGLTSTGIQSLAESKSATPIVQTRTQSGHATDGLNLTTYRHLGGFHPGYYRPGRYNF